MLVPTTRAAFDDNTDVDKCSFEEILTTLDDYGNDKEVRTLSYNFTRSLFSKIIWAQFPDQNMMKVAPGFRFTPEFQSMVSSEPPLP